jgi:hypothetical protein
MLMYWLKITAGFFISCFFILPFFKVEDPLRSIALRFFSSEGQAEIYEHICNPDRIYRYQYILDQKEYKQRYDGYVEALDNEIPETLRCQNILTQLVPIKIKYFNLFRYWSEPLNAERLSPLLFWGVNIVKIGAILILITTFVRPGSKQKK